MCLSRVMIGVLPGHKISHRMFGQHNLFVRKKQHEEKDLQLFFLVHSFLIKYWTKLRNKPTEKSFLWGILLSEKETFCCFGCLIIFLLLLLLLLLFSIFSRVRNVRKHRMPKAKREHKKIRKNFCSSVNLGEIVPGEQICVVFRQENHLEMGSPGFKKSQLTI